MTIAGVIYAGASDKCLTVRIVGTELPAATIRFGCSTRWTTPGACGRAGLPSASSRTSARVPRASHQLALVVV
jgi:hypothetical protein